MLRIEKVFLQGFKSFCDPTEVVFDAEGITAVVGPNGCGKSNLSEAISWVIGEQRARALRGGKMEDVIFQGSGNRAASGMAEVLLTMVVRETFEVRSDNVEVPLPEEAPAASAAEAEARAEGESAKKRRKAAQPLAARVYQEGEEITIGRRLYRTGESEYEMNGRTCRLRDVQDLFSGTGLGGAHYAIIEQGRIGQVLSAKPLDRRALIEEAAGVSKFKMRQHAAELKLEASRQNLSRLTDIIIEIERQQNSLKRQASRARRYQRLRTEMRDLMRAVFVADYRVTRSSLTELESAWDAVSSREVESQTLIVELEGRQAEAALEARNAETELNESRQTSAQAHLESERSRQQLSYLTEQLQSAQTRAAQFARDRETILERSALIAQERQRLGDDIAALEEAMKSAHESLARDEEFHRESLARDAEAERRLEAARTRLYETTTHLERWRHLQRQFAEAVGRCEERMQGLGLEEERARTQAKTNEEERVQLDTQLIDGDRRQSEISTLLVATEAQLATARNDRTQRSQSLATLHRELTACEHRLKSLVELDARHAYFSEAVQLLLQSSGAKDEVRPSFTTLGTLADHLDVAASDESLVESVLSDELEYVLVPSFDDAFAAIDFLRSEGGGRATFIVAGLHGSEHPSPILNSDFPESDPSGREEIVQAADSSTQQTVAGEIEPPGARQEDVQPSALNADEPVTLIKLLGLKPDVADTFARAFPNLAAAAVVENIERAMDNLLAANGSASSSVYLTRRGERIVGGSLVSGGVAKERRTGILALRREISELRDEFTNLSSATAQSETALQLVDDQIARLEADRLGLDTSLRSIEKETAVLREQWQQCERERQRIEMHLRVVTQETAQVGQELFEYRAKLDHAGTETSAAGEAHSGAEFEVTSTQAEVAELRQKAEARAQEIARQRADYAAGSERRRGLQNDINRLESESRDLESRLSRSQLEAIEADASIAALEGSVAETTERTKELTARLEEIGVQLQENTLKLNTFREQLAALDAEVRRAREAWTQAREDRAQLELDRVRLSSALEHIAATCRHELGENITEVIERLEHAPTPEEIEELTARMSATSSSGILGDDAEGEDAVGDSNEGAFDISFWRVPENFDLAAAKARLDELRGKIDALGAINMMALEELAEVEERYVFLTGQKADIEKAVSDTQAAIAEIRRRSRERFLEAFTAINANFSVTFQELFGGGRGEMRLIDENDILESGIEIIAQPPGKRLQNVLLLSGGEKAMAAIALVLAIFKYRPSPFCILDEVDAPLDEVNIGRFADKVTEMSRETQFVIITHSKRTMEAAGALYGVTMEDPGVSKLISVRLT